MNQQDIEKLVESYIPLIRFVSGKNCIPGHTVMDFDEIHSECLLVFAKCVNNIEKIGKENFDHYFKKSMYNKVKSMWRWIMRDSNGHLAIHIDLSDIYETVRSKDSMRELYIREEISIVKSLAFSMSVDVLDCVLCPPDDLIKIAMIDVLRKRHVTSGQARLNKDFRIMKNHIAQYLGVSNGAVSWCVGEIKEIIRDRTVLLKDSLSLKQTEDVEEIAV